MKKKCDPFLTHHELAGNNWDLLKYSSRGYKHATAGTELILNPCVGRACFVTTTRYSPCTKRCEAMPENWELDYDPLSGLHRNGPRE